MVGPLPPQADMLCCGMVGGGGRRREGRSSIRHRHSSGSLYTTATPLLLPSPPLPPSPSSLPFPMSPSGAHILSGNVFEPRALTELLPDWGERGVGHLP